MKDVLKREIEFWRWRRSGSPEPPLDVVARRARREQTAVGVARSVISSGGAVAECGKTATRGERPEETKVQ